MKERPSKYNSVKCDSILDAALKEQRPRQKLLKNKASQEEGLQKGKKKSQGKTRSPEDLISQRSQARKELSPSVVEVKRDLKKPLKKDSDKKRGVKKLSSEYYDQLEANLNTYMDKQNFLRLHRKKRSLQDIASLDASKKAYDILYLVLSPKGKELLEVQSVWKEIFSDPNYWVATEDSLKDFSAPENHLRYCRPIRLNNRMLTLEAAPSSFLSAQGAEQLIRQKINAYYGQEKIRKVKVVQKVTSADFNF